MKRYLTDPVILLLIGAGWLAAISVSAQSQTDDQTNFKLNQAVTAAKNRNVLLKIRPDPTRPEKQGVIYPQEYRASGVIIEPGLILTNFHILKSGYRKILADNKKVAKIIKYSPQDDLLLIATDFMSRRAFSFLFPLLPLMAA